MMKSQMILCGLISAAFLSACGVQAEQGSPMAARFMAAETVGSLLDVEPVWVKQDPEINGDTAKVTAETKKVACDLTLVRHATANRYGWATQSIDCHQPSAGKV